MRSSGNNFNYFPVNQVTKLAYLVQFERVIRPSYLGVGGLGPSAPWLRHWSGDRYCSLQATAE